MAMWIDHLVWYSADLAEGRKYFGERMDCEPAYGGEHPGEGTANAIMALGPSTYLEILGEDPAQGSHGLDPEISSLEGHGVYHWAVGGISLETLAERARMAGVGASEPVAGGRAKPDGRWLGWTCLGIRNHGFGSLVPFFIDWMDGEHPAIGAPYGGRLVEFIVYSPQPDRLRDLFRALELDIAVRKRAEPGFTALLECGRGRSEVNSFLPLPRGYVI